MKISGYLLLVISSFFVMTNSFAAETHNFSVSTIIDKAKLFNYEITDIYFDPAYLPLKYEELAKTFKKAETKLNIQTTIPDTDDSIRYELLLSELNEQCYDQSESELVATVPFTHFSIEGKELTEGSSIVLDFLNSDTGFKEYQGLVELNFERLPLNSVFCKGSVHVIAEMTL